MVSFHGTYSIIWKIDISLDSQYTGNKRIGRAENIKQFINIVKFPQFFKHFAIKRHIERKKNYCKFWIRLH